MWSAVTRDRIGWGFSTPYTKIAGLLTSEWNEQSCQGLETEMSETFSTADSTALLAYRETRR